MRRITPLVISLLLLAAAIVPAGGAQARAAALPADIRGVPGVNAAVLETWVFSQESANLFLVLVIILLVAFAASGFLLVKNIRLSRHNEKLVRERTAELNQQTTVLSAIFRSVPDLVFCKDLEGTFTFCNASFEAFAGVPREMIIGSNDEKVFKIDPEMVKLFREADERIIRNNEVETIEELITYPDGSQQWVETYKTPLLHDGAVVGLMGISRNITQRKDAEAALERRFGQQRLMAGLSLSFISGGDIDVLITDALHKTGEFLGVQRVLLSQYKDGALHCLYEWQMDKNDGTEPPQCKGTVKELKATELEGINVFRESKKTHYVPEVTDTEDGLSGRLLLPLHVNDAFWGIIELDRFGRLRPWSVSDIALGEMVSGLLSGAVDNMLMSKGLERMSAIVNSSPQYIAYVNGGGGFEFINPATYDITGYTHDELMSGGLEILYDDETNEYIFSEIMPRIYEQGSYDFELPLVRKDGERRIMSFSAFSIQPDDASCGTIATDVTEQKLMERQLIEAKELAEANSRSKSEFLSRMSHEIRTPMNAIIGMTNIAKTSDTLERKDYCLDKINSASTHLLGVINDVLDMSKIEAGKFELSYTEFDLEKLLMRITNVSAFRMEEKSQQFSIRIERDVPHAIVSDEQRLSQVITNLLSNAAKFTPENGRVALYVRKLGEENGYCDLEFEVEDTGIGISDEQKSRLFQSFEQADGSISRKYGGTGLGLAISKRIVELMDGSIRVESEVDKGSRFIFRIRAEIGTNMPKTVLSPDVNWSNLRIVAVDDELSVREYFLELASGAGIACAVAESGEQALEIIASDGVYHVIFVDWSLPGMDGIELTRRIRARYGKNSVIIMISATEWSAIEQEALAAGVDRFIPKPLFASVVIDCITECLGAAQLPQTEERSDEDGGLRGRTLLLAEDIEINREIVITLLEPTGIKIDCAEDGGAAVRMFRANPVYDIVFMDIHMPEVDGFEATRQIRALDHPRAKTTPIIAMTANVFREDIEKCLDAGMNGHVGKPLDFDEVLTTLRQYMT